MSGIENSLGAISGALKVLNLFDSLKKGQIPSFAQGGQVKLDQIQNQLQSMVNENLKDEGTRSEVSDWLKKHNELQKRLQRDMKKEPVLKPVVNLI